MGPCSVPSPGLGAPHVSSHGALAVTSGGGCSEYFHATDEVTEAQGDSTG